MKAKVKEEGAEEATRANFSNRNAILLHEKERVILRENKLYRYTKRRLR